MNFDDVFKAATGHGQGPFDYQRRLACGEKEPGESEPAWLSRTTNSEPRLRLPVWQPMLANNLFRTPKPRLSGLDRGRP